jgi:hypothetical protein
MGPLLSTGPNYGPYQSGESVAGFGAISEKSFACRQTISIMVSEERGKQRGKRQF